MPQPAAQTLRLSSPADLLEAVPYLLGFHPQQSLVALALRGPRRRLAFTMRLDLPEPGQEAADMVVEIAARLVRADAEHAALVVYDDPVGGGSAGGGSAGGGSVGTGNARAEGRGDLPHLRLVAAVADAIAAHRIELIDAVYCVDGRWWSYTCVNPACCPVSGTPTTAVSSRVAAAATFAGLVALPSREALEASLEPTGSGMRAALTGAAASRGGLGPAAVAAFRVESLDLLTAAVDGEPTLSEEAAVRLVVGLADVGVRDACCQWAQTPRGAAARRLWTQLGRRAGPPHDAVPMCLLAWFAYLDGDATLAGMALARSLRSDPGYRFAQLLGDALDEGIDPALLRPGAVPSRRSDEAGAATRPTQ